MDNAQKAIMVGVGLFITIIIISAVLLIVNLGTGLVDDATDNLSSISSSLQNNLLAQYDNKQLTGAQVKDAMQKYMTSNEISLVLVGEGTSGEEIVATVGSRNFDGTAITLNAANAIGIVESVPASTTGLVTSMRTFTDQSNTATYINSTSKYVSRIIYLGDPAAATAALESNRVVGVVFVPASSSATSVE